MLIETKKLKQIRNERYNDLDKVKLRNMVDMALGFTAMMRLFEKESKETIQAEILKRLPGFFEVKSEKEFKAAHRAFCLWGMKTIKRTKGKRGNKKVEGVTSFGHMAKILDVALHVAIHYAQRPDPETARMLSQWLNPAMDNKMMKFLAGCYPDALERWPKTIEQVTEKDYYRIQETVRQFIKEEKDCTRIPIDFDDVYWEVLTRKTTR